MIPRVACSTLLALSATCLLAFGADEDAPRKPRRVVKTDREWQRILTPQQFFVTRLKGTEPAFSGRLVNNHARGLYACVCCGADLFSSRNKFDSGTGWPSFWRPLNAGALQTAADYSGGDERVEVMCSTCGAHLGHVFNDGPAPTGLRFCINSVSLKFVKGTGAAKSSGKGATSKKTSKAKGQDKAKDPTPTEGADPEPESASEPKTP